MMNTKLKKWASAFIDYYFENTTSDKVCLGISKEDLPLVYQFHETYLKLPNLKVTPLEDFMKCFMKETEIDAPGNRKVKDYNLVSKSELERFFIEAIEESIKDKQPYYLPYIALFIMPLTDDDIVAEGERRDNYYERLEKFINEPCVSVGGRKQNIKSTRNSWFENSFPNGIQNNLPRMWRNFTEWISRSYPEKWDFKSNNRHIHVGPFLAESTLTASQKKRFPKLFIDADIQPNSIISLDEAKSAIKTFGKDALTGYSETEWNDIINNKSLLDILVSAFFEQYKEWNGESHVTKSVRLNDGRKVNRETSSGTSLAVHIIYYEYYDEAIFEFKAFKKDFSDTIELSDGNILRFRKSGWAKAPFNNNVREFLEGKTNHLQLLRDDTSGYKASFRKSPVYIFEENRDTWATTNKIKLGETYLIMTPPDSADSLNKWIIRNGGVKIQAMGIPEGYSMYSVQSIKEGYDDIPALHIRKYPTIEKINGVTLSHSSLNITLSNSIPIAFAVDGIAHDDIKSFTAQFENSSIDLIYDKVTRSWSIDVDRIQLDKEFKLELNGNKACDRHTYRIVSPTIKYNDVPRKNIYGRPDPTGTFHGLTSASQYTLTEEFRALSNNVSALNPCEIYEVQYDRFLFDLSATEKMTKDDFKDIAKQHVNEDDFVPNYDDVLADLEKNGYIERTYVKGEGTTIMALPPTLVMVPPAFTIETHRLLDGKEMVFKNPSDYHYKGLILGGRSEEFVKSIINVASELGIEYDFQANPKQLMPVTISVFSRDWEKLEKFAQEVNMRFDNRSFFSAAVLNSLPSIMDYFKNVVLTSEPTYKYSPDPRSTKSFACYDYAVIAANLMNRLNGEDVTKENRKKETKNTFDPDLDLVAYKKENKITDIILWYKHNAYHVDYFWGHLIICALKGIDNIIQPHPENNNILCFPEILKFPTLIARALTLSSGELPKEGNHIRSYKLIYNPAMTCLTVEEIKSKLFKNS